MKDKVIKEEKETYFECERCRKNSFEHQWVPCPRGGCEAEIKGTIITTVTIKKET